MHILIVDVIANYGHPKDVAYILYDTQARKTVDAQSSTDAKHFAALEATIPNCDVIASHGATRDMQVLQLQTNKPWVDTGLLPWGVKPQSITNMCKRLNVTCAEPFSAMNQCVNLLNCLLQVDIEPIVRFLLLSSK